jgi:hypothetical protein
MLGLAKNYKPYITSSKIWGPNEKNTKINKKPNTKTMSNQASNLGLNQNYFFVMEKHRNDQFKYILSLNSDLEKGYTLYLKEIKSVRKKAIRALNMLKDYRKMKDFDEYVKGRKYYSSSIRRRLLEDNGNTTFKSFINLKKLIEQYEQYRKEKWKFIN